MLFLGEELWQLEEVLHTRKASTEQQTRRSRSMGKWGSVIPRPIQTLPTPLLPSPSLWLSWFHLENMERGGHRVIPWPHQISPNRVRCLARVKTSNLKGIKCKCDDHMPTSNTDISHRAALSFALSHTAEPFTCLKEWGAIKMTMGFCHVDQVQNISTAGQVLSSSISIKRTFARTSLQLNYSLPLRKDIAYTHLIYALISFFILTSNLKHVNKVGDAWKGYPGVQGEKEKKKQQKTAE